MRSKSDRTAAARKAAETRRRRAAEARLSPGQSFETAMLSPVVRGRVRVWTGDESSVWRVEDASAAGHLLGRGAIARTGVERDRFREVGLIDRPGGVLLLPQRLLTPSAEPSEVLASARAFKISPEPDPPVTEGADWRDLCEWLREVVPAAVDRGEFVVVERGGWDHQGEPFAFVMCAPSESGWTSHIEAVPPPPPGSAWPPRESPDQPGQTVSAPANKDTASAAAILLVDAVIGWAKSPLDLAITFGTSPHGPFALPTRAQEKG